MAQARRRVSYIIPSPLEPVPRLQLPPHGVSRLGATGPLLVPYQSDDKAEGSQTPRHPRHRLGVAALALDVSTQLVGRTAPEGILYSGGRDGLIMSWDLGARMKKRKGPDGKNEARRRGRWEIMTGWDDEGLDEETDDAEERLVSDGDVLGDVTARRRPTSLASEIPYERQWETDMSAFQPGTRTQFRQSAQAHTDWINDILLCNYNQTVVSASSDGTVKAWSPHANTPTDPSTIGSHSDYVRCLAHCREQNWVASGSFDRTIKLWDLHRTSTDPLVTLNPPDALAPKSSVYAIAADPFGRTIVSGSPERVVRLWDPRTGRRTGKLVGHTDNIRAILISEDSKYLLTGSADASVKLWSLASQRCLHTFTHHTDSVWSLFSDHPSLEVFYSGDRSGLVCRIDVEDCADISDGECLLLCNESADQARPSAEGINKIVAMDDNLLWTATGTSTIKRWNIPQRRATRVHAPAPALDQDGDRLSPTNSPGFKKRPLLSADSPSEPSTRPSTGHGHSRRMSFAPSVHSITSEHWRDRDDMKLNGISYDSLIKLVSPNDPFASYSSTRARDPEVATLYSAASVMSVPRHNARSPQQPLFHSSSISNPIQSSRTEETIMANNTARALFEERELAADALPFCTEPDDVIQGDHGFVRSVILNDRTYALTVDTAGEVAVWDIIRGLCVGRYPAEVVAAASHPGSTAGGSGEREHSPREALEAVRERIEGEAVVATWCNADTKAGVLTIHLTERCFDAEVYADEVGFANDRNFNDESKLNIGKWVLRNLFIGFIKEELRLHKDGSLPPSLGRTSSHDALDQKGRVGSPTSSESHRHPSRRPSGSTTVVWSPTMVPAVSPTVSATARSSPLLTPLIPLHLQPRESLTILPSIPQSPAAASDATATPGLHQRARSGTLDGGVGLATPLSKEDYFAGRTRHQSAQGALPSSPDDLSGWTGPNKTEPQTPSTPSGLIGRLKNFGKTPKRLLSDTLNSAVPATPSAETPIPEGTSHVEVAKTPLQLLLAGPLEPPSSVDAPLYRLPPNTTVLISTEAQPSYTTIYRGTVMSTQYDLESLEAAMPMWLLEYLLLNQIPPAAPLAKMSFVLMPWNKDPDVEPLPELLNTAQSKLTASRYLRVRKIVNHVQDKLDKIIPGSKTGSVRSFSDNLDQPRANRPRAEDEYEILCNETLLPLGMSLAAVRQYIWKQSIELVLHYRRKRIAL
ncbi:hypothetical protein BJ912DRAFT_670273 [Pholiota molesta]|nr:hypothetical protein BJ912DRAFT_670273 [Pholiota molesta]